MFNSLKKLFAQGETKQVADGLNQDQREAMIDLFLLCIYADNELALNEDKIFVRNIERFNWKSEQLIGDYIQESKSRTLDLIQSEAEKNSYLNEISTRLKTSEIKFRALKMCKLLFYSDWELAEEEIKFIKKIRTAFGLK
ncbi:MAG: hypothetical protein O3C43_21155 [Verrucomicrobia bacterium]|nr:hypothetical protein [Verrucomicrobiota bacterium]MDA1069002.1 hypothetical protein [Verrucomicrobiota bacterium]